MHRWVRCRFGKEVVAGAGGWFPATRMADMQVRMRDAGDASDRGLVGCGRGADVPGSWGIVGVQKFVSLDVFVALVVG